MLRDGPVIWMGPIRAATGTHESATGEEKLFLEATEPGRMEARAPLAITRAGEGSQHVGMKVR